MGLGELVWRAEGARTDTDRHGLARTDTDAGGVAWSRGTSGGGDGYGGFEGFGFVEALFPGLPAVAVEGLGDFEIKGLADAVWLGLRESAEHGLGAGDKGELALVVRAEVFPTEIEDAGACNLAGLGDGITSTEAEVDEGHGAGVCGSPRAKAAGMPVRARICERYLREGSRTSVSQLLTVEPQTLGSKSAPRADWLRSF